MFAGDWTNGELMDAYLIWLLDRIERLRVDRRRMQWRRYNTSERGRRRNQRYETTPGARVRKQFYEMTTRATMRAPTGVRSGTRKNGEPKYGSDSHYRVTYAHPLHYGVTASSPELVAFEQRVRPDEWAARMDYAQLLRRERAMGLGAPSALELVDSAG